MDPYAWLPLEVAVAGGAAVVVAVVLVVVATLVVHDEIFSLSDKIPC